MNINNIRRFGNDSGNWGRSNTGCVVNTRTPSAVNVQGPGHPNRPIKTNNLPKGTTIDYKSKGVKREHVVNIDSRARDHNKFSNPNSYRIQLKQPFKKIVKLELVTAEIPHTDFIVNEYNNKLDLIDNGNTVTVTLPMGDYDANELANQLKTSLDALGFSVWTIDFANGLYTFSSTNNFSFLFSSGSNADSIKTSTEGYNIGYFSKSTSPRELLGFPLADTTSGTSVSSTNKIKLGGENYIIMELGPDVKENLDWFDDSGHSAFGKIVFSGDLNVVQIYNESMYDISRSYDPPLPKLEFLYVKFRIYGGNLYNFRGHEHSFMLRVTTLE